MTQGTTGEATAAYEQLMEGVIKDLIFTRSKRGLGNVKPGHVPNLYRLVWKPGDVPEELLSRVADVMREVCGSLAEYDGLTESLNTCDFDLPISLERTTAEERVEYYAAGHVAAARFLLEAWRLRPPSAKGVMKIREHIVGVDGERDLTKRRTGSLRETYEKHLLRDIAEALVDRHAPDQAAAQGNAKSAREQTRPQIEGNTKSFPALAELDRDHAYVVLESDSLVGDPIDALVRQLDRFVDIVPVRPTCSLTGFWRGGPAPVFALAAILRPLLAWSTLARTVDGMGIGGFYRLYATLPDEVLDETPVDDLVTGYVCGRWVLWNGNTDSWFKDLPQENWLPPDTMLHELFDAVEESDPRATLFCKQLRDELWAGHRGVLLTYVRIIEWCIHHCTWTGPWPTRNTTGSYDGCVLHTAQFNAKVISQLLSLVKLNVVELDELPNRCSQLTSVAELLSTRLQEGWRQVGHLNSSLSRSDNRSTDP